MEKTVASKPEKVVSVEGITEYRLSNGLRVLLFPDPTKPTITVNITYLVGSRHEGYGETGMAHLLEHLMFKGSKNHPNIPQELSVHGARPNGTTWFDRTNYFETFDATDANLQWALDLEADRMVNSFIAKRDLDSEMTVVRNEFEMGENSPENILEERVMSAAFLWHNYGKTTIGARSDIENVPIDHLQAFWRKYYQPDNAVLLVAGRLDEASTLALVDKTFSGIPRPDRTLDRTYTREPTQDGERWVNLERVGDVQLTCAVYHVPAASHADAAPMQILGEVLGATPSGRLHKALVETKKAARVAAHFRPQTEPGVLFAQVVVREGVSLDDAKATMLKTLDGAASSPPSTQEIDRARVTLLKNIDLTLNQSDRLGLVLSEWIATGDWRLYFFHRDRLRAVSADDVKRVAATYLKPSNRTVGVFTPSSKPDRSEIPEGPDLAVLLKDYKGSGEIVAGEAFDATPANIESRTHRTEVPGGLRLALLPKKTRGASVALSLIVHFGDEKSLSGNGIVSDLCAAMLMRGSKKHSREQIRDEFDRLRARVGVADAGPGEVAASIETVKENLSASLRLLAEVLREPAFPAQEFEQLRQERLARREQERSEPQALGPVLYQRRLNPYPKGHIRYTHTVEEAIDELKSLSLDDAKKFYASFYGASHGDLSVVGDFDASALTSLAKELFSDWKSPAPFVRVPRLYFNVSAGTESVETPDKANAIFLAGFNVAMRDDDADYPAMALVNYMLGGGFLNSRLATRIRQKEGISYGVGSSFTASPLDIAASFTTYAIYAPQNASKLETAFDEELTRALKDGFTDAEIAEAKSGYLKSRQVTRAEDQTLARLQSNYLYWNRTFAWDTKFESQIAGLESAAILSAARKYLDPKKISIVRAGDFSKVIARP
jgi:zinc protease